MLCKLQSCLITGFADGRVQTKNGPAVTVYMVMVREYITAFLNPEMEKSVKDAISRVVVGGRCVSISLGAACTATMSRQSPAVLLTDPSVHVHIAGDRLFPVRPRPLGRILRP